MKSLKIMAVVISALVISIFGGLAVSAAVSGLFQVELSPLVPAAGFFVASFIPVPCSQGTLNQLLFTHPGGAGVLAQIQLTYLPQFLSFTNAVAITSARVETKEDGVLHDFQTAAMAVALANFGKVGAITANQLWFRLADGELKRNCTISIVTSGAGVIPVYGWSQKYGNRPYKSQLATTVAGNPETFEKFTFVSMPTFATATDRAVLTMVDGYTTSLNMEDMRDFSSLYQQVEGVVLDNRRAYISKAVVTTAAATPCYIFKVA